MKTTEATAMAGALIATAVMVLSAVVEDTSVAQAAYFPSVFAGAIASVMFAVLTVRAWKQEPPGEMIAWVFGHLAIWATAFTLEECGWSVWRALTDVDGAMLWSSVLFFQWTVAPVLKVIQGAAIFGLIAFTALSRAGVSGHVLTIRIRLIWALQMLLIAAGFLIVRAAQ